MRAISIFIFDEGISTRGWRAIAPLRMRVRKSAMGSVVIILWSLPTGFHDAGNFALERVAAETDAAHFELSQHAARTAANPATAALAVLEFQLLQRLGDLAGSSHS